MLDNEMANLKMADIKTDDNKSVDVKKTDNEKVDVNGLSSKDKCDDVQQDAPSSFQVCSCSMSTAFVAPENFGMNPRPTYRLTRVTSKEIPQKWST